MAMAAAAVSLPHASLCVSRHLIQSWRRPCIHLRREKASSLLECGSEARGRHCSPSSRRHVPKSLHVRASTTAAKEEEEFSVLTSIRTAHNDIVILDTPKSRFLLLDSSHNIHSLCNKEQKWTGAYWDEFASLPAIIPQGPIAILGLGGGTAAHLMLDLWPSLMLEGWEIDEILLEKAREYLGLSELEEVNEAGGVLNVHAGDAFSPEATVPGGFAGIVVDLFLDGEVLPELEEVTTWLELNKRLMPNGRIMVNCGGSHSEKPSNDDGIWVLNPTIKALCKAFPGKLSWKRMTDGEGENFLALTGPEPDLDAWSSAVPGQLSANVRHWKPCQLS